MKKDFILFYEGYSVHLYAANAFENRIICIDFRLRLSVGIIASVAVNH